MRGRKMHELEVRNYHMRCLDTAGNHPEKDGNLLIGMLVGVLIAVPVTILLLLLLRNSRFGARIFSRGPAAYSRTFYSRTDSGDH
jgi:ribose/xylose/arabinose/galactoside ABC-type transport system permease subunit